MSVLCLLSVSSLPCLNQNTSVKNIDQSISSKHDVDRNLASISKTNQKDFQDKRKDTIDDPNDERIITSSGESNIVQKIHLESIINNSHNNIKIRTQADNRYNTFQYLSEVPPDLVPESINDDEGFGNIDNGFLEDFNEFQCVQEVSSGDKAKKNNSVVNQSNFSIQSSKGNFEPSRETDFQVSQDDRLDESNDKLVEGNTSETLDDSMYSNAETERSYISEEFVNVNNIKIESKEKNVIESININKSEISHQLPNDDCKNFEELRGNEFKPEVQKFEQDKKEAICEANVSHKVFVVNDGCDDFGEFENHQFEINECNVDAIQSAKQSTQTDSENGKTHDDDSSGNREISCETEVLWASDPFGNLNGANIDIQIFEKSVQSTNSIKSEIMPKLVEKDFDDGGDYNDDDDDDDFGDFNNYSLQTRTPNNQEGKMSVIQKMCGTNSEVTIQQAESIILEMFAAVEQSLSEYCHQDFTSGDKILGQLKDVTDTCALSYQWSKSQGQNCLLKALNIDTRNIVSITQLAKALSKLKL